MATGFRREVAVLVQERNLTPGKDCERDAAEAMSRTPSGRRRRALGMGMGYDSADFVAKLSVAGVTPRLKQNASKQCGAFDGRTTRHGGDALGWKLRPWIETQFG